MSTSFTILELEFITTWYKFGPHKILDEFYSDRSCMYVSQSAPLLVNLSLTIDCTKIFSILHVILGTMEIFKSRSNVDIIPN